jgi:hypothetical protein
MTAINTPINAQVDSKAFRRGLLAGLAASALLAVTMTVAAFASGLVQPAQPATQDQPAPITQPAPNSQPVIDEHNPLHQGPRVLF